MSFKNWLVGSQAAVISLTSARTSVKRDSEKHMEKVVIYRAKMPSTSAENTAALGRDQSCNGLSIYQFCFPLVLLPSIETKLTKTPAANNHLRHLKECSNPASAAILTENVFELSFLLCGVVGWEVIVQFYSTKQCQYWTYFCWTGSCRKKLAWMLLRAWKPPCMDFLSVATAGTEKTDAKYLSFSISKIASLAS